MPKILVVDDESSIRELVKATLMAEESYQIDEAADGEEALRKVQTDKPDLILLDIGMPIMDGIEVCRQVKSNPSTQGIFVLMLTAMTQEWHKEQATTAGADDFFGKPFSPIALLDKVYEVLKPEE